MATFTHLFSGCLLGRGVLGGSLWEDPQASLAEGEREQATSPLCAAHPRAVRQRVPWCRRAGNLRHVGLCPGAGTLGTCRMSGCADARGAVAAQPRVLGLRCALRPERMWYSASSPRWLLPSRMCMCRGHACQGSLRRAVGWPLTWLLSSGCGVPECTLSTSARTGASSASPV